MAQSQKPATAYGVGYQQRKVDRLCGALADAGATALIDVRANTWSRRPDANGPRVRIAAEECGMEYEHHPQLGISRSERAFLHDAGHYQGKGLDVAAGDALEQLLDSYEARIRSDTELFEPVATRLRAGESVGLLCFERDPTTCHRTRLLRVLHEQTECEVYELTEHGRELLPAVATAPTR